MWYRGKLTRCVSPPAVRNVNLSHAVWRHHVPPTGYHTHNHYKPFKIQNVKLNCLGQEQSIATKVTVR